MPYWDERFKEISKTYPDISTDQFHIDGLTIKLVLEPQLFDVIVASNLFGDIISDLGPATAGTIGIAPSANLNPEKSFLHFLNPFMVLLQIFMEKILLIQLVKFGQLQ